MCGLLALKLPVNKLSEGEVGGTVGAVGTGTVIVVGVVVVVVVVVPDAALKVPNRPNLGVDDGKGDDGDVDVDDAKVDSGICLGLGLRAKNNVGRFPALFVSLTSSAKIASSCCC